jgi:hypothetical protein
VLFTALKPGRTLALLYAEGRFAVWRLRVGGKPVAPPPDAAKRACSDLKLDPKSEPRLTATVSSEACWRALRELFEGDQLLARELELTFDGKVLQAQLKGMQAAVPKLSLRYVGAGLVLGGQASDLEHKQALWQLFKNAVGRVALDDKVEVKGSPDAGAKAR